MANVFRKTQYVKLPTKQVIQQNIPTDLWVKCDVCGEIIYKDDFHTNNKTCVKCEQHFRLDGYGRVKLVIDEGTFVESNLDVITKNVLNFPGYDKKIEALQQSTGLVEGVITGTGEMNGCKVALGVMDSRFLMGSMGAAVGEKITRLIEEATMQKIPLIIFTASGGARMQEGIISLMQMAKTSAAIGRHSEKGGLYITVLTDPTTGGVTASFAMLGDVILAEPGSLIGFAGPRVIKQTIKQDLPEGFQRAEFLLEHGFVDKIVKRNEMKETLYKIVKLHGII
ncbi:MAG: acetyl-CoA carboxylase carboxyl transferase subunit beta [Firmicutes bacterium HGW-Firmicutes-1]|jgi:acetyl-CoA carboxylase carboxyl transferase subunit beta|nr:MAG: acetyl-CoA carboxylase carboxyl transferase subunit beta [Firmicutes bacterium HGW-Firmicutes-1]